MKTFLLITVFVPNFNEYVNPQKRYMIQEQQSHKKKMGLLEMGKKQKWAARGSFLKGT